MVAVSVLPAHPEATWLLALLPLMVLLGLYAARRRRAALARFGEPEAVAQLVTVNRSRRRWGRVCFLIGIVLLIVGIVSPRWGKGDTGITIGRDVVVILDLSKSMLTADMAEEEARERWTAAKAGIRMLVERMRNQGGHRLGLVVFAAKPWTVCPLTLDHDHFLMRLEEFSPLAPPPEVHPGEGEKIPSGTRIGAAIQEAIAIHDRRAAGFQDIVLLSDGDDPGPDREDEIADGINEALKAGIPVHVVGVGDPKNEIAFTYLRGGVEELVGPSKMQPAVLEKIATRTHGSWLRAENKTPRLDEFFQTQIEGAPGRELPDDAIQQPKERYLWFLLPSLMLLFAGRWLEA